MQTSARSFGLSMLGSSGEVTLDPQSLRRTPAASSMLAVPHRSLGRGVHRDLHDRWLLAWLAVASMTGNR
jgi:hypothetical protein